MPFQPPTVPAERVIPRVAALSAPALLAHPEAARTAGPRFVFGQSWRETPEPGFRPASAWLVAAEDRLLVYAELAATVVRTTATADQQRLWELGDVFEILLQAPGAEGYFEFQVAPNGCRLQLRYPRVGLPLQQGIDPYLWPEGCLQAATDARPAERAWRVAAVLPVAPLLAGGDPRGAGAWRVAFCRYDYDAAHRFILSASAAFQAPSYHRLGEWTRFTVPGGFAGS